MEGGSPLSYASRVKGNTATPSVRGSPNNPQSSAPIPGQGSSVTQPEVKKETPPHADVHHVAMQGPASVMNTQIDRSKQGTPQTSAAVKGNNPTAGGSNSPVLTVVEELNPKLTLLGLAKVDEMRVRPLRPRPKGASASTSFPFGTIPLMANHFPVTIRKDVFPKIVYHYDVVITPKEHKDKIREAEVEEEETTVPERLLHVIWHEFENRYNKKLGARMPFDGKKNCYSSRPLDLGNNNAWSDEITMVDPDDDDRKRTYKIQLKLANEVKTDTMFTYLRSCETWQSCELPQEVIQALDVALRYSPSLKYTPCNRSFYSSLRPHNLSELLDLWFGHNQSLLLGRDQRATLNVDMANKAFLKRLPVVKVMSIVCKNKKDGDNMNAARWREVDLREAESFLKGKLVEYGTGKFINGRFEKRHRFVAVKVVEWAANAYKFTNHGEDVTIQEYFEKEKGIKLEHPDWPVVHVGNRNMTNYVPIELCNIVPQAYKGQLEARDTSEMIKGAAKPPADRFRRIQTSRDNSQYDECPILEEFGLIVGKLMVKIMDAKRIPKPELHLRNEKGKDEMQEPKANDGKFQIGQFLTGARVPKVGILNVSGQRNAAYQNTIQKNFMCKLAAEAKKLGMRGPENGRETVDGVFMKADYISAQTTINRGGSNSQERFTCETRAALQKFKNSGCQLVIVIMGKDGNEYPTVKNEAEVQIGILTQCVKESTVSKVTNDKGGKQVLINILLKINAKLGGINFKLGTKLIEHFGFEKEPMLILGADVTHPAPHSKSPSVAAITASYDLSGVCFGMHIQVQEASKEVIAIKELHTIIRSMMEVFREKTGKVPKRIIMFRDGVSEGQFPAIKESEFKNGIIRACESLAKGYRPKVTFLVVKKRHHTRFLTLNDKDSVAPKNNIPPGTVVDSVITHPTEMEYFLNSHVGIQGTSKPTRYHVLHDDSGFSMEQLEKLTYCLCYTFVRCTQPVSYPAPTYYAHLAAFRARALLEKEGDNASLEALQKRMTIHGDLKNKYPMFYV